MSLKFRRKKSETHRGLELAPLIDVISFIVIYFLMNSTLEKGSVIKIQLPRSSATAVEKRKDELVISVNGRGDIFLNDEDEKIPLGELKNRINIYLGEPSERKGRNQKVIIRGDGDASYQTVIKVIDEVNAAGIQRFNLAMKKK